MTLDATDWVWTRSTSRGLARTVLLAIADKCPDASCTAYAGTAMLVKRTRAARSSVRATVDKLLASGELAIVEGVQGPGGETVYKLPHAVGHTREASEESGFEGAGSRPGPESDPGRYSAPGGPVAGPGEGRYPAPGGAVTGPQNAKNAREQKEQQLHAPAREASGAVVEQLRPLLDALDAAGIAVRWSLGLGEQRDIWQLVQRHGVAALVKLAARRTAPGEAPKPARYWLKVWGDLDRSPTLPPGTNVVPLHGRPTTAPTSHTDTLLAGLALLEGQEDLA